MIHKHLLQKNNISFVTCIVILTLVLTFNVVALADNGNELQQTQVENVGFNEVSGEIEIIHSRNIRIYPMIAKPPFNLIMDASESTGGNLEFHWDLGDGTTTTGAYVEHTYNQQGNYAITLEVSNDVDIETLTFSLQLRNKLDFDLLEIPFSFGANPFDVSSVEAIMSDYEVLFSPEMQGNIHVRSDYEKQEYVAKALRDDRVIAKDVLLPSHTQEFEFTTENTVRASLFLILQVRYGWLFASQHSQEQLVDFYEAVYPQLDANPEFMVMVNQLNQGNLLYGSVDYDDTVDQMYEQYVASKAKEIYEELTMKNEP